jgi:hypothetical protein
VLVNPAPAWSAPVRFGRDGDTVQAAGAVVLGERLDPSVADGEVVMRRIDPSTGLDLWSYTAAGPGSVSVGLLPVQGTAMLTLVEDGNVAQWVVDLDSGRELWV